MKGAVLTTTTSTPPPPPLLPIRLLKLQRILKKIKIDDYICKIFIQLFFCEFALSCRYINLQFLSTWWRYRYSLLIKTLILILTFTYTYMVVVLRPFKLKCLKQWKVLCSTTRSQSLILSINLKFYITFKIRWFLLTDA